MISKPKVGFFDTETIFNTNNRELIDYWKDHADEDPNCSRIIACYTFIGQKDQQAQFKRFNLNEFLFDAFHYSIIFFHNLKYDANFIIKALQKAGYKQNKTHPFDEKTYDVSMQSSKIFSLVIYHRKGKAVRRVEFKDSALFLAGSLRSIGKALNLANQKLSIEEDDYDAQYIYDWYFNNQESEAFERFREYALMDVLTLRDAMVKLDEFLTENGFNNPEFWENNPVYFKTYKEKALFCPPLWNSVTISGLAFNIYLAYNPTMKEYVNINLYRQGYEIFNDAEDPLFCEVPFDVVVNRAYRIHLAMRQIYKGGMCNGNPRYQNEIVRNVLSLDLNSAYPTLFKNEMCPVSFNPLPGLTKLDFRFVKVIAKTELTLTNPVGYIFYSEMLNADIHENFPSKIGVGGSFYVWEYELEYVKNWYAGEMKMKFYDVYGCYVDQGGFVDKFYSLKEEYSKKVDGHYINPAFRQISKWIMNAVTGKIGQKAVFSSDAVFDDDDLPFENHIRMRLYEDGDYVWKNVPVRESLDGSFSAPKKYRDDYADDFSSGTVFKNFLITSHITAKTRCLIAKFIQEFGEDWVYSDTDSCKIIETEKSLKVVDRLQKEGFIDDFKLGAFKIEDMYDEFIYYHPKAYAYKKKDAWSFTFGGCDQRALKGLSGEDIKKGTIIPRGKSVIANVKDGLVILHKAYEVGQ